MAHVSRLCGAEGPGGFVCTRTAPHTSLHAAILTDGSVAAHWPQGDKPERPVYLGPLLSAIFGSQVEFVGFATGGNATPTKPAPRPLEDRVADDLAGLLPDDLGPAMPELPDRRDLSRYEDALAVALRHCPHEIVEQPLYGKPVVHCIGCGRYMDLAVFWAERRERSR